ncbi:F0F1 ATP synthase subunit delta [Nicoliella spurrieriana]|uniref:ATP synthase subunit delta n=1 Tax=Nicoliella spurrieriana TaxID=2925830 RepID=A0A976X5Q5_9LACO|nr:ATP synthase F1 subunit delta [Nicoliella spurrieriana]UQS86837.1 F0F1 ATP synthase subunit delta [Nicoliella spurrieriana]
MSLDKITFSKRYAQALFDLLKADNELDSGYADLQSIKAVFDANPSLASVLSNVSFPEADKDKLVKSMIDSASSKYIQNLIKVLAGSDNMDKMVPVIDAFQAIYDDYNHIVNADLISAVALDTDQQSKLKDAFAKRIGADKVVLNSKVDPSIIGGLIIKSSDVTFDGSVKSKLNRVKQLLLK